MTPATIVKLMGVGTEAAWRYPRVRYIQADNEKNDDKPLTEADKLQRRAFEDGAKWATQIIEQENS